MIYFIIAIGFILIYIIYQYNEFIHLKNKLKQAKSGIDVYLTQRFDLIPNLVECVKVYAIHEKEIFQTITQLRNQYMQTKDLKDGELVNQHCNTLLAMGEEYPKLKSNTQFLNLQKNLAKMENQLQAARRIYNSEVTNYNIKLSSFPSGLIGNLFHFTKEELFEAEEKAHLTPEIQI